MDIKNERKLLSKLEKDRQDAFNELKGVIRGFKAGSQLSMSEENTMSLFELVLTGLNNISSRVGRIHEFAISNAEKSENLEEKIANLEIAVMQLRETLDKLSELR